MLNITFEDADLTINTVTECVYLHSDLLDLYEEVTECAHYSYMCESTNIIMNGIEKIRTGIREMFTRLKNFVKTVVDKLMSVFVKKSRATNVKKDRLKKLLDSIHADIEPFTVSTYNFTFKDNLESLFNLSYGESGKITSRINDILNNTVDDNFYALIDDLQTDMVSEDYFNMVRKGIIRLFSDDNVNIAPIPKNQFIPELERHLRGGTVTKTEMEITKSMLYDIIDIDDEQMKIRKNLETYKNRMITMFNKLESDFNNAVKIVTDKSWKVNATVNNPMRNNKDVRVFDTYEYEYSEKLLKSLNDLFSASIVYFKNLSDISSIALTEYSKAVMESIEINNQIFATALTKIERVM